MSSLCQPGTPASVLGDFVFGQDSRRLADEAADGGSVREFHAAETKRAGNAIHKSPYRIFGQFPNLYSNGCAAFPYSH